MLLLTVLSDDSLCILSYNFTVSKWSTVYHKVDSALNVVLWLTDTGCRAIQGENYNEMLIP